MAKKIYKEDFDKKMSNFESDMNHELNLRVDKSYFNDFEKSLNE